VKIDKFFSELKRRNVVRARRRFMQKNGFTEP
jgi:hypothetical protein